MATSDDSYGDPSRNPCRSPLPTGLETDEIIERRADAFLSIPKQIRDAAGTMWHITLRLAPERVLALVAFGHRLLEEDPGS